MSVTVSQDRQPAPLAKPKGLKVTPRVARAVEAMVWDGKPLDEAAREAELTTRALRLALAKPHVLAMMKAEKHLLQTSHGPRNIHRLAEIRDAGNNMPAVQAIGMLERMADDNSPTRSGTSAASPGVTIHIHAAPQAGTQPHPVRHIDAKPLITLDRDSLHENVASDE